MDLVAAEIESAPPQGGFGWGVHPLAAREVWLQNVDLGFFGAQAGVGHGFDVALGAAFSPTATGLDAMPVFEAGYARTFGELSVRGLVGAGAWFGFGGSGTTAPVAGAGAGVGVAWGPRQRHLAATLRVLDLPGLQAGGFNLAVDGVLDLSPPWTLLGAATWTVVTNEYAELHELGIGPGGRLVLGRFSMDLSVHLIGIIGEAGDLPPFLPLPLLILRYQLPGARPPG